MVSPPCSTPCGKEIMIGNRSNQDPFRKELEKPFHVSQAHITACGDDVKQHPGTVGFLIHLSRLTGAELIPLRAKVTDFMSS